MRTVKWLVWFQPSTEVVEDVGDSIATTDGKWSVLHLMFGLGQAVPFPDGADGLSLGQQAMMLGMYSEFAY